MTYRELYAVAADALLVIHGLFVLFLVLGLLLIYLGKLLSWQWVRNPWFRITHLLGISVVAIQSWFGMICPLTIWEMSLRSKAGEAVYSGAFVANWVAELLYFQAPPWVFVVCYTFFGALVLSSWFVVRPRSFRSY
jgi:Protein of Unknown function (DUF2784)